MIATPPTAEVSTSAFQVIAAGSDEETSCITGLFSSTDDDYESHTGDDRNVSQGGCLQVIVRGRSKETTALYDSYRRLQTTETLQLVLLHGESGCGKTALVDSMRESILDSMGHFVAGKYFQNACLRNPYSAIMAALSDLCDLIVQDPSFDEGRRLEIKTALGSDGAVLAKVVSGLNSILSLSDDEQYSVETSVKNEKTFLIFKGACKKLLTVLSSSENPLVIFVDDIQWMDRGSQELLLFLIRESELTNVMFILSYREENASNLVSFIDEVHTLISSDQLLDVGLMNLDVDGVHELVHDYLGTECPPDRALSELVWQKTMGNCFHVHHFLESIQHDELLTRDDGMWNYDIETIRQETSISANLADSLSRSIQRLPQEMQDSLKVASLLGYRFDAFMVAKVIEGVSKVDASYASGLSLDNPLAESVVTCDTSVVSTSLFQAFSSRFIEKVNGRYQFNHDKIQAAFQNSMDEKETASIHRLIAETYMALIEGSVSAEDSAIAQYHAAIHFHEAGNPLGETGKLDLATLDLAAAKFSMEKSAFIDSAEFLQRALGLLDRQRMWVDQFDLAFELTNTLARVKLVLGSLGECKELAGEAIANSLTTEMKIPPMIIDCEARMADSNVQDTILACTSALRILGLKLPRKIGLRHVLAKLFKVRRLFRLKSHEDILNMPLVEDQNTASSLRFLFYLSSFLFLHHADRKKEAIYCSMCSLELSLKMGLAPPTSTAIAYYAVITLSMGDFDQADRLGKLALTIAERMQCKEATIFTTAIAESIVLHSRKPITETFSSIDQTVTVSLECGDTVFGIYAFACACTCNLLCGTSLPIVEEYVTSNLSQFAEIGENAMFRFVIPVAQFTLNMQSSGCNFKDLAQLSGDMMEEGEYHAFALDVNNYVLWWFVLFLKLQLNYHFGFYTETVAIAAEMYPLSDNAHLGFHFFPWYFYAALAHVELYRLSGRATWLRGARFYHKALQRRSHAPTASLYLPILNAEMMSVQKRSNAASVIEAYEHAIRSASELGYCHLEALANERAYAYMSSRNVERNSRTMLDRALHLYGNEWKAEAKCEWLTHKFDVTSLINESTTVGSIVGHYISVAAPQVGE